MPAEKTAAIILRVLPYRESSYILYLFTERMGLIHGIAKGVRKRKTGDCFLERGFCIETVVYRKPHRDLHTLGAVQTTEFFPEVRADLIKSAMRDAAFEIVLAAVAIQSPHPELFTIITGLQSEAERLCANDCHPFLLWRFFVDFADSLGLGPSFGCCRRCRKSLDGEDARLHIADGGLECLRCRPGVSHDLIIPAAVIDFLRGTPVASAALRSRLSPRQMGTITHLLADYCRYHFDIRSDLKTLAFLDSMV